MFRIRSYILCAVFGVYGFFVAGCPTPVPVATITYTQLGACQQMSITDVVSPPLVLVFFEVTTIDNTQPTTDYNFTPLGLYIVDPATGNFGFSQTYDGSLQNLYNQLVAVTVPHGTVKTLNQVGAMIVTTTSQNAAPAQASQTNYFLQYHTLPNTPGVAFAKTNTVDPKHPTPYATTCSQLPFPR
jgi:hypothetical protein